jgi:hypothetical protein
LIWLDHINYMMWNFRSVFLARLSRPDIHASIDRSGISGDYLSIEYPSKFHGKRGLATGCLPDNYHKW